ncbi:hypothetical protein GHT06_013388 [Daphnia sinensis]|uniref:Uncharacterized protein n=1 Tax=Daphnia sinensis TaxID=1820382 RepID=A0AAD5LHI3_9CRUS|nr:hypothetical protein GHT06_013388 [Daphnia sinensis]
MGPKTLKQGKNPERGNTDRLKRLRTSGNMIHTKIDTVKALRAIYVRDFDSLEKRHDRYSAFVASGASSRHSSTSSRLAQIHEAGRKEKEAELMLQQIEDKTRRREEEDAKIRESVVNIRDLEDYRRQVENNRRQRELRDEIDRRRLSGTIMRQKLFNLTVDDQTGPTRAPSIVSGLSRASRISSQPSLSHNPIVLVTNHGNLAAATEHRHGPCDGSAMTTAMTTPLVGSTKRIPTPTRLFGQPVVTMPSTPKVGFLGQLRKAFTPRGPLTRSASVPHIPLNAGASNTSMTTGITNPTFSTPPFTSVITPPVTTSQPMPTVSNSVTPPTSGVPHGPTSIVPRLPHELPLRSLH